MAISKQTREKVYLKCKGCCAYCGQKILYRSMQVDHIVPKSNFYNHMRSPAIKDLIVPSFVRHLNEFDMDHIDNLNPACRKCNKFKDNFDLEQFRKQLECQLDRARNTSSNYRRALQYNQVVETPKPIVFHFEAMLDNPKNYTVNMTKDSTLEDEMFEFLVWYQKAPLDGKNQAEIIDIYLNCVRKQSD